MHYCTLGKWTVRLLFFHFVVVVVVGGEDQTKSPCSLDTIVCHNILILREAWLVHTSDMDWIWRLGESPVLLLKTIQVGISSHHRDCASSCSCYETLDKKIHAPTTPSSISYERVQLKFFTDFSRFYREKKPERKLNFFREWKAKVMEGLLELPKDECQVLSKFIEEDPAAWGIFKLSFKNSNQAILAKKNEVLSRPVWIELHVGSDYVRINRYHLEKPALREGCKNSAGNCAHRLAGLGGGDCFKICLIEKRMRDLIN